MISECRVLEERSHLPQTCMSSNGMMNWQKLLKGGLTNVPGTMTKRGYNIMYLSWLEV